MRLQHTRVEVLPRWLAGAVALVVDRPSRPYVVPGGVPLVGARDGRGKVVATLECEDARILV